MKYSVLIILVFSAFSVAHSQAPAETLATKIALKMKDSLALTSDQQSQLYTINMQLHDLKMLKRQQYAEPDSINFHLQKVENTRDSLYHLVLTDEQFLLYRNKKTNIVNNN